RLPVGPAGVASVATLRGRQAQSQSRRRPGRAALAPVFFNDTAPTEIYTLSLHDALPILMHRRLARCSAESRRLLEVLAAGAQPRSEEHTSELQSPCNLVCRLLLEKKKRNSQRRSASAPALTTLNARPELSAPASPACSCS